MATEYKSVAEEIEAMLNGHHESYDPGSEEEFEDEEFEDENQETQEDAIDTDDTEESEEESEEESNEEETKDYSDDSSNETSEEEESEEEAEDDRNNQEENKSTEEEDDTKTSEPDGEKNDTSKFSEDEFKKLKEFYEKVTGEFKANGKTIKGFNDPEKIIQGLQKAIGFEEKNAIINKHRKILVPLKEKGFLDDQDKFNLFMSIADGDKEAIKTYLKSIDINPVLDLDLDEIKYVKKEHIASNGKVTLDNAIEDAEAFGIKDKLTDALANDLDDESFQDFLKFPKIRADLINHMQDGTFELVKDRISELRTRDLDGEYKSLKYVDQYRYALNQLADEYASKNKQVVENKDIKENNKNIVKDSIKETTDNITTQAVVLDEKAKQKIIEEEEAKFREETRKKIEIDNARKEAASVSKVKKTVSQSDSKKNQDFDPLKLSGDDFKDYFNSLMR